MALKKKKKDAPYRILLKTPFVMSEKEIKVTQTQDGKVK